MGPDIEKCVECHSIAWTWYAIELELALTMELVVFEVAHVHIFVTERLCSKELLIVLPLAFEHRTIPFPCHRTFTISLVVAPSSFEDSFLLRAIGFAWDEVSHHPVTWSFAVFEITFIPLTVAVADVAHTL